jgi:exosortase D (VPLPA-CTERM-specific)
MAGSFLSGDATRRANLPARFKKTRQIGVTKKPKHQAIYPFLGALLAVALILISQHAAEADLFASWQTEEYSHGILIPFIAVLLAWHRLAKIKPSLKPSYWGLGWLATAGAMQMAAQLSGFDMAAQYSLVIALTGISLAFFGERATAAIAPALVYLLFAIPLPHLIEADLSGDLQLLSSTLGVAPLDWIGIPVFQQGNVIDLGGYRLQVVEACNGLRYIFPLMSFGYLVAFLLKDKFWKRAVLFLSTIPIAILLNALRITFIGLTVDLWGTHMAEGFLHVFEGWSVFLICIAVLMGETWGLMQIGRRGQFHYEYFGRAHGPFFKGKPVLKAPGIIALACALLFALLFGSGLIEQRNEIIPFHPPLASFPLTLGDWHGEPQSLPPDILQALRPSDYLVADYRRGEDSVPVNLYIAYYASQRAGAMIHSPSNCIPGGGWQIENSHTQKIQLTNGTKIELTRLLIRRGDAAQLVYYWFDERGRDLTETYGAKWYLLRDSIAMHRTDGALIRLVTPLKTDESEAAAAQRLMDFLALAAPEVAAIIPGSSPDK